jgi:hypothetical protein
LVSHPSKPPNETEISHGRGVMAISLKALRNGTAEPRVFRFTLVVFIDWLGIANLTS